MCVYKKVKEKKVAVSNVVAEFYNIISTAKTNYMDECNVNVQKYLDIGGAAEAHEDWNY